MTETRKIGAVDGDKLKRELLNHVFFPHQDSRGAVRWSWIEGAIDSCRLPQQPAPELRSRIEAGIKKCDQWVEKHRETITLAGAGSIKGAEAFRAMQVKQYQADLLRWVLGQPQDTWIDADFGLEGGEEG